MQNKKNVFMYPMWTEDILVDKHPYVNHLVNGMLKNFKIANYGDPTSNGIMDLRKYFLKTDIIYLNWIESAGYVEAVNLAFYVLLAKILRKKIIWTHHNRVPHKGETKLSKAITNGIKRFADFIVAHTIESYSVLGLERNCKKVIYFFHPFFSSEVKFTNLEGEKKYDLLIWGNVRKSKGVQEFLDYLKSSRRNDDYKIKIVGKFENAELYDDFRKNYKGRFMEIENRFVSTSDLNTLHTQARYVFFPYTGDSVLNSGAVVTSLPKGTAIIGPTTGAFKELGSLGLIRNYSNFEEVLSIVDANSNCDYPVEKIKSFCELHSWENFSNYLLKSLSEEYPGKALA